MKFTPPLKAAVFVRRYKRFLADVLIDGALATVHCANTGSMTNCIVENSPCWLSHSDSSKRKYPYTLEIVSTPTGHLAGVNTLRANALVAEALESKAIAEVSRYNSFQREVPFVGGGRADFMLCAEKSGSTKSVSQRAYLEVKSVTYGSGAGLGLFPDAKSDRAKRHLVELMEVIRQGESAVLLFCVQHTGIDRVAAARLIDPDYARLLQQAAEQGVEILAYRCRLSAEEIAVENRIEVDLSDQ